MLVTELINKINFNDSCVNKLVYEKETLILDIDLCMWKQKEYNNDEPELMQIVLKFFNCKNYKWDSDKSEDEIDYDSIVDIICKENSVKIVLEDDDVSVITFESSEVIIE